MIRIIGGDFRSRQLQVPPDDLTTRPYTHRVKESIFNLLRGWFDDARVLDLFSGVGTMGLEAVSRGATEVVMVEQDRRIARLAEENVASLGCGDRAQVVMADALGEVALARAPRPIDIVFIDPPYPMMADEATRERILTHASRLAPLMATPSFLILRSPSGPRHLDLSIEAFDGPEAHEHGKTMWVLLYQPSGAEEEEGEENKNRDED